MTVNNLPEKDIPFVQRYVPIVMPAENDILAA